MLNTARKIQLAQRYFGKSYKPSEIDSLNLNWEKLNGEYETNKVRRENIKMHKKVSRFGLLPAKIKVNRYDPATRKKEVFIPDSSDEFIETKPETTNVSEDKKEAHQERVTL